MLRGLFDLGASSTLPLVEPTSFGRVFHFFLNIILWKPLDQRRYSKKKRETRNSRKGKPSTSKPPKTNLNEPDRKQNQPTKPNKATPKRPKQKSKRPNQRPNDSETNSKRIRNEAEASLNAKPGEVTRRRSPWMSRWLGESHQETSAGAAVGGLFVCFFLFVLGINGTLYLCILALRWVVSKACRGSCAVCSLI